MTTKRINDWLKRNSPPPPVAAVSAAPAPALLRAPVPKTPQPDPGDAEVEKLLAEMREAVRRAGIQRDDPMMPLLTALARSIRFMGERTSRSDTVAQETGTQIMQALLQSRQNANAEIARFQAGIASTEADTIQRVGSAIARSADAALTRRIKVFDRNTALCAAAALFIVAAGCLGGGYWWGRMSVTGQIDAAVNGAQIALGDRLVDAEALANLVKWNPMGQVLQGCRNGTNSVWLSDKRLACNLPVYIQPPLAAALP